MITPAPAPHVKMSQVAEEEQLQAEDTSSDSTAPPAGPKVFPSEGTALETVQFNTV